MSQKDINIERIYSKMIKKGGLYVDLSSEVLKKSIYAKGLIKLNLSGMKGIDEKINLSSFIKSVDNLFQKSTNHFSTLTSKIYGLNILMTVLQRYFLLSIQLKRKKR